MASGGRHTSIEDIRNPSPYDSDKGGESREGEGNTSKTNTRENYGRLCVQGRNEGGTQVGQKNLSQHFPL